MQIPQWMNCISFFHLVPLSGQTVSILCFMIKIIELPISLSCTYMQNISAKHQNVRIITVSVLMRLAECLSTASQSC